MPTKTQSNLNTERTPEEDVLADLVREGAHSGKMGLRDLILEIAKSFLQAALLGELMAHLKGEKEIAGVRANKRNGTSKKRVKIDIGVVEIDLPRDRNGTFKPILIPKHARTFGGLDSRRLVAMYARGMREVLACGPQRTKEPPSGKAYSPRSKPAAYRIFRSPTRTALRA